MQVTSWTQMSVDTLEEHQRCWPSMADAGCTVCWHGGAGEENIDLVESLRKSTSIQTITVRHEQAGGFMAATYGRLTGCPLPLISVLHVELARGLSSAWTAPHHQTEPGLNPAGHARVPGGAHALSGSALRVQSMACRQGWSVSDHAGTGRNKCNNSCCVCPLG